MGWFFWWIPDFTAPRRPGKMHVFRKKGIQMRYVFEVNLPAPAGDDPGRISWLLSSTIDGVGQTDLTGPIDVLTTEYSVPALPGGGSPSVHLSLVHVDKAGNKSLPSVFDFSQPDDLPPVQPGQLGVTLLRTEEDGV